MSLIKSKFSSARRTIRKWLEKKRINKIIEPFKNKNGIEIGGTTKFFSNQFPLYRAINNLDGCNYSVNTIWEGKLKEGLNYNFYKNKTGFQYIKEANNLDDIPDEKYDFLVASHCLEHCANPIKALKEWVRVVKSGGYLLVILPDKRFTFDHKRSITKFEHLKNDFEKGVTEHDLTHLDEILTLHDLSMDTAAGNIENFKKRALNNFENRGLHHHVFDFNLLEEMFVFLDIEVKQTLFLAPYHQIIIGIKK